jgi:NAD(P)-dependent dehydrogenase (short-subunit alcohol dehydrogenase family)
MASILITGASKGIGMATAVLLGRAGHQVYATMRNPSQSPELAKIAADQSLPITISVMDVDSDDSVSMAITAIRKKAGNIDVLVNNAGIEDRGSVEESDLSLFKRVMETNYFGMLRCIKAILPQMRDRKNGCIINISSVAGRISTPPLCAYSASKFAVEALSEALAQEVKSFNIRVAIIQPGIIDTSMPGRLSDADTDSTYPQTKRVAGLFREGLQSHTSPALVGEKILEIVESGSWKLRHPVGPDAEPFLQWRASMNDEQWIDLGAADDETWYQRVQNDFGVNARPKEEVHHDITH